MSEFIRRDLPADITVFAGDFASQPLAFAHLLDLAPDLGLGHVEVVQGPKPLPRLAARFPEQTAARLLSDAAPYGTLILILPAAFDGLACPVVGSEHLIPLGVHRGTVPRMVAVGDMS
jgi:hypothetical protein